MKTAARPNRANGGERGFALLLVFLMAAAIGIALFAELPRVAIQSQRAKEQLLIERGEQFKRALQLFMRANKGPRRPADMDELDRGYNNMRFLRHRYKDPMTGKDEWRIIHMQGGVLVDSLLNKPKEGDKKEDSTLGQNISAQAGLGETANAGQGMPNAMNRRRPSEGRGFGGGAGTGGQPGQSAGQDNGAQPGDASGGTGQPGSSGAPGGPTSPFGGASGTQGTSGQPATATGTGASDSGSSVGSYGSGLGGANPVSNVPGSQNATNNQGQNTAAADMINKMMMGPRPGGMPGQLQGSATSNGMAGVASTVDSDGLMLYGDRSNYREWEFTYDPTKDRPRQDPRNMLVGNQMGTPSSTPGAATASTQAGAFNQTGQTMTGALTGANAQTGAGGQLGATGQNGTSSNTGTGTSSQGGQGGTVDIRPGRR